MEVSSVSFAGRLAQTKKGNTYEKTNTGKRIGTVVGLLGGGIAARTAHVSEAQYALGCMYEQGEGTQPDLQEAIRWYKVAANQGHTEAQAACRRLTDNDDRKQ